MLIGDFHAEPAETVIHDFSGIYNLANLVEEKHVLKTRVNLPETNKYAKMFSEYHSYWNRLSDFHKMCINSSENVLQ